jgi:hypothetical protein
VFALVNLDIHAHLRRLAQIKIILHFLSDYLSII